MCFGSCTGKCGENTVEKGRLEKENPPAGQFSSAGHKVQRIPVHELGIR